MAEAAEHHPAVGLTRDLQDPRSSGPRCRVLRNDCKPFVPIKPCAAGLEPIDASELASFVPPASGERISVRGVLGLDSPSSTFAACHQVAPGMTDCCNMASSEVFVGGIANGVRLDRSRATETTRGSAVRYRRSGRWSWRPDGS